MLIVKLDKKFKKEDIQRDKKSGKFKEDDFCIIFLIDKLFHKHFVLLLSYHSLHHFVP